LASPPNHLSHVVYCVHPDNFDAATDLWSKAFDVEFDRLDMHDGALRVAFSLAHGIEIVAPAPHGPAKFHQYLEKNGEGVYTVVYVVADIDETESRLSVQGVDVQDRLVYTGRLPWSTEWAALEERFLPEVHGMRITIARMERR
jgi:hypothetical protein